MSYIQRRPAYPSRSYRRPAPRPRAPYRRPARPAPVRQRNKYAPYYKSAAKGLPAIGSAIGGAVGGPPGAGIGGAIGSLGNSLIQGFGDYHVKKNVFLTGAPPIVKNISQTGSGGIVISFREFLGNVTSSSSANTFDLVSHKIVPTDESSFPWLSGLAGQFQEWTPEGIVYEFRSTSADALNSTNTALGVVMMATNYNAALPNFESEAEMLNSEYSSSVKPSDNVMHMIECKRSASVLGNLYTKTTGDEDVRFSQLGNFQIATDGFQAANVQIGQLWVTYQIALTKPKLYDALSLDNGIMWIVSDDATDSDPLGATTALLRAGSNMNSIAPTRNVLTLPYSIVPKQYAVNLSWTGGSVATVLPGMTSANGVSLLDCIWRSPGSNESRVVGDGTDTALMVNYIVLVEADSHEASLTFDSLGTLPTSAYLDIKIIEITNDLEDTLDTIPYLSSQ